MTKRVLGLMLMVKLFSCAPAPTGASLTCGAGTVEEGGACVTTVRCADGTHDEGGACVADAVALVTCGAGTHLVERECVIDTPVVPVSPWSAAVPVCAPGVACSEPTLVKTPGGAVVVVSESGDSAMSVAVYRQTETGFVLGKRFEGSSQVALTPSLAARGATLFLAYTDYTPSGGQEYGTGDLMLSVSGDLGVTWSEPRRIITALPSSTLLYSPRLTVSAAGLDLVWVDTDGQTTQDNLYAHSDDDGLTFSEPVRLPSGGQYDSLSLASAAVRIGDSLELPAQRSGYDVATRGDLSSVEVLSVTPMPSLQTKTSRIKRVYTSRDFPLDPVPVLAASEGGVRCLAFVDAPSRDVGVFVVRSEGPLDASSRPHAVPGGTGSTQTAPSVGVTADGGCAVAWLDNRSGAWEVYETVLEASGAWREPVKVTREGFTEDGVTKTLSPRVSLVERELVWTDFRDGKESVSYSRAP